MITAYKKKRGFPAVLISFAVFAALIAFVLVMLANAEETSRAEALAAVEQSIIRAAVSCYAYEGFYPADIEYLEENYNLVINRDRYIVFYDRTGDNLMPNIIVAERRG